MLPPSPAYTDAVAIRLADEGVPIRAIARALQLPSEAFRPAIKEALSAGRILELPVEDWPAFSTRATRAPRKMILVAPDKRHKARRVLGVEDGDMILTMSRVLHTTRLQTTVLLRLMRRGKCTKEMIHEAIENNRGNPAEPTSAKLIDVVIFHLRRKLRQFDVSIETVHAIGYSLSDESRDKIYALLNQKEPKACNTLKGLSSTT